MGEAYEKKGYLTEDFRLFHLHGAQGVRTEYHYHEFCKVLLLLCGSGSYWVEGRRYALQPGDIVLVGSGCVHRPEFEDNSPYERIILYISPDFLRRASTEDCDLLDCFSGIRGHVLRPDIYSLRKLQALALELERELSGREYGREILASGLTLRLLVQLGREMSRGDALLPSPAVPQNRRIAQIMAYIDQHLTEELPIETIAEQFYLSKYHMMRTFRSSAGISIGTYITQRRLLMARELISQGLSATESCFRSGFGSYSSFTRSYSRYFGTTPTGRKCAAGAEEEGFE